MGQTLMKAEKVVRRYNLKLQETGLAKWIDCEKKI